jgi:spore germination protein GerM
MICAKHRQGIHRTTLACALGALAVALAACGTSNSAVTTTTSGSTTTSAPKTTTTVPPLTTVSLYFVRGTSLGVADRQVNTSPNPRFEGIQALLAGPNLAEAVQGLGSAIPAGTSLRGLQIRSGVATVNLSPDFTATAAPAVEAARLAQIVYTLTGYLNVSRVSIQIGKVPLTSFAGVNLGSPVGRSQVTVALPAVLLENPAVGGSVVGSLRVSGITSLNGTYEIQLVDPAGRLLAGVTNTAVVGGSFSQVIPLSGVSAPTTGTLTVFARATNSSQPPQTVSLTVPVAP